MRKGHWESYALIDGLPAVDVFAILEDREGYLWFGTEGGGVSRYDGESFVTLTTENGLADNSVTSILEESLLKNVNPYSIEVYNHQNPLITSSKL